jgi:RNA polymerase sigma-70 factor (ECF subfamily)
MGLITTDRARWIAANILPHDALLRGWLHRLVPAGLDPDDIAQEAYARLASLPSVAHVTQPKAYLFQVAKSLIWEHLRRSRVVDIVAMADFDHLPALIEEMSPERIISGREELERVFCAVKALPAACRQVFELRKFEDLTQRAIAERLGISESSVEKHLSRALRLVVAALASEAKPTVAPKRRWPFARGIRRHGKP